MATSEASQQQALCQECRSRVFRYQCPRCSFRSCSLPCCRAHKKRTQCNGQRNRTEFKRLAHMTDERLVSDYHFLEDVLRTMDTGKRVLRQTTGGGVVDDRGGHKRPRRPLEAEDDATSSGRPAHPLLTASTVASTTLPLPHQRQSQQDLSHLAPKWRHMARQTGQRRITLLFLPAGMQRRLHNQSYHVQKKDCLHWTVEWILHTDDATAAPRIVRTTVSEQSALRDALPSVLFRGQDATPHTGLLHVLIQQIPRATYATLSLDSTLREALVDLTVIEFPTLCLVTPARLSGFSIAVQAVGEEEETTMMAQPQEADNDTAGSSLASKDDILVETVHPITQQVPEDS
jgi:hypothetical protein